mgnify:CR=1 FL=1
MELLLDPNIAYLLVVASIMMAIVTIIIPGTGVPEAILLVMVGLCWYTLRSLQPNGWALLLLALSIVPFVFALRQPNAKLGWLAASLALLLAGSVFLFTGDNGLPLVNLPLAALTSVAFGLFLWFGVTKGIQAQRSHALIDPDRLIGMAGTARTNIHAEGSVYVAGEMWSARSDTPIQRGSAVRVVSREGLILTVCLAAE